MVHVYIAGARGVPRGYGGYDAFVDDLVSNQQNKEIQYWIATIKGEKYEQTKYKRAYCLPIKTPRVGAATMLLYDILALRRFIRHIKRNNHEGAIIYILASRIGPFIKWYVKKLHKIGAYVCLNPDGHEWKRTKWSLPIRKYWKLSERLMAKNSDLIICDSVNIEKYIQNEYSHYKPKTIFIPYGANTDASTEAHESYMDWCINNCINPGSHYLVVGRFVPENNYETIIREFMKTTSQHQLVIITDNSKNSFMKTLCKRTGYDADKRILFPGTVFNQQLLKRIREHAVAYIHGHEVGGTNPSLLEGLASTQVNILLNVCFNQEVGGNAALYFTKEKDSLKNLIEMVDCFSCEQRLELGKEAKQRIRDCYLYDDICRRYEEHFTSIYGNVLNND